MRGLDLAIDCFSFLFALALATASVVVLPTLATWAQVHHPEWLRAERDVVRSLRD